MVNVDATICWDAVVDTYMKVDTSAPVEQQASYVTTYAKFRVYDYCKRCKRSIEYVDTVPTPFDYGWAGRVADSLKALGADGRFALDILMNGCPFKREVADLIRELINNVGELRIYDAVEGLYCDVPTGGHDA
ncbi:unnamed protein product [Cylicostephanus goldi]|uniref:Uncharacterized protein n=1 Tax=Cylicostephanus goldi TaxID=71465 RepID=A0A3P7MJQ1_CYLGO|nr:unnamed protein product [Cylicostephanus goldi]